MDELKLALCIDTPVWLKISRAGMTGEPFNGDVYVVLILAGYTVDTDLPSMNFLHQSQVSLLVSSTTSYKLFQGQANG